MTLRTLSLCSVAASVSERDTPGPKSPALSRKRRQRGCGAPAALSLSLRSLRPWLLPPRGAPGPAPPQPGTPSSPSPPPASGAARPNPHRGERPDHAPRLTCSSRHRGVRPQLGRLWAAARGVRFLGSLRGAAGRENRGLRGRGGAGRGGNCSDAITKPASGGRAHRSARTECALQGARAGARGRALARVGASARAWAPAWGLCVARGSARQAVRGGGDQRPRA